jgi:DNA-binding HxlR family transcriptional regulator
VRCSENYPESFQHALDVLGKRWTGIILFALGEGSARFGELATRIQVIGDRMLSERLKELESEGLVDRRVFAEVPVRVEYRLTLKGEALLPVYEAIGRWSREWIEGADQELEKCPQPIGSAPTLAEHSSSLTERS